MERIGKNESLIDRANREVQEEEDKQTVGLLKDKLRQLRQANKVVGNLQREIEDLELKLQHDKADNA